MKKLLIKAGAALNIEDTDGNTALGLAALFAKKSERLLILAGTANLQVCIYGILHPLPIYGSRYEAEIKSCCLLPERKKL